MDVNAAGDAGAQQVQYITASEGEVDPTQQQQYIIQDESAAGVEQQQLIQGAKIVDGQIVLPQQYVTDSGETVILVYENPDGTQQFMTEDGQQIVFEQEGDEGGMIDASQMVAQVQEGEQEQQPTYVTADEAQEMAAQGEQQQTDANAAVPEIESAAQVAPGQSLLAAGITMADSDKMQQIAPGQSLLAPSTAALVQQQQQQQEQNQDLAAEGVEGGTTTTIVSDPSQIAAVLAGQQVALSGDGTNTVVMSAQNTEGMTILSQAVSAIEQGVAASNAQDESQISVQSLQQSDTPFPQTVKFENYNMPVTDDMQSDAPTTLMADGKEIQVRVLSNAEFAATHGGGAVEDNNPPLETLKLRQPTVKSEESVVQVAGSMAGMVGGEAVQIISSMADTDDGQTTYVMAADDGSGAQQIMMTEDGQILSGAQVVKGENGEQILFTTNVDPNSAELQQFIERIKRQGIEGATSAGQMTYEVKQDMSQMQGLVIAEPSAQAEPEVEPFGPGVINPETGLMEEPSDEAFTQKEDNTVVFQMPDNVEQDGSDMKLQVEIFNEKTNKSEVTLLNVPMKSNVPQLPRESTFASAAGKTGADDEDDSDFDEENLTPKVVYERLLAQHRRTKECQVCGELLENFLRLKEHLMEHAGYNPCECQKCGRILSTPEGRYRHEKAHDTKNSPSKGFESPREKQVSCPVCGKQIARKEHLKRHMLIHQDCPTYKCLLCGYSFKREDLIKGHVKKFHPKQVEASSLELLFEKSSDDMAPQRSQWNPHRVYRSGPKPVRVPGRGRGRPRKSLEDADSPLGGFRRPGIARSLPKNKNRLIIRAGDGSIVVPKDERELMEKENKENISAGNKGLLKPGQRDAGKRSTKTPKRFIDDEEYDESEFLSAALEEDELDETDLIDDEELMGSKNSTMSSKSASKKDEIVMGYEEGSSDGSASPLLTRRYVPDTDSTEESEEESTRIESADGDMNITFKSKPILNTPPPAAKEKKSKTSATKKARSEAKAGMYRASMILKPKEPKAPVPVITLKEGVTPTRTGKGERAGPKSKKKTRGVKITLPEGLIDDLPEDIDTPEPDATKKGKATPKQKATPKTKTPKIKGVTKISDTPLSTSTPKVPKSVSLKTRIGTFTPRSSKEMPMWSKKKHVVVSFVGHGDEMDDVELQSIRPPQSDTDIEEEIVVVMGKGGKGSAKITSVKTPHSVVKVTPKSAAAKLAAKAAAKNTPKPTVKSPVQSPVKQTPVISRSGRVIQRKLQPDEVVELPTAASTKKELDQASKKLRDQQEIVSTPKRGVGRPSKASKAMETLVTVSVKRGAKRSSDDSDIQSPLAKKSRVTSNRDRRVDGQFVSSVKTVRVSLPERGFKQILEKSIAFPLITEIKQEPEDEVPPPPTPRGRGRPPKQDSAQKVPTQTPRGRGRPPKNANQSPSTNSVQKPNKGKTTISIEMVPKATPGRGRPPKSKTMVETPKSSATSQKYTSRYSISPQKSPKFTSPTSREQHDGRKRKGNGKESSGEDDRSDIRKYGTVTIEKGRIVGEITIGQSPKQAASEKSLESGKDSMLMDTS